MIKYSERLKDIDSRLVEAIEKAAEALPFDILIVCGRRTIEQQKILVDTGKSKTMNSNHLTGRAVDIVPFINNKCDWGTKKNFLLIRQELLKYVELEPLIMWDINHYGLKKGY